jgi:hypothetical protein
MCGCSSRHPKEENAEASHAADQNSELGYVNSDGNALVDYFLGDERHLCFSRIT